MTTRNFYIIGEMAFTWEYKVVTNLFVEGIGRDVTENDLREYFEIYGEVTSLLFDEFEPKKHRNANVQYKSPISAAKVLMRSYYRNFTITAGDNWLQPLLDYSVQKQFRTNQQTFLTNLDDDVLYQIISQLKLKDQLSLACSHERFVPAFEMFAKIKFKSLCLADLQCLSRWQLQQFFIMVGYCIKAFDQATCNNADHQVFCLQLLAVYCPNLKILMISGLTSRDICDVLSKQRKLSSLFLHEVYIRDECLITIANLTQLEQLAFIHSSFDGCHNVVLPNLKELHIINCKCLNYKHFENALFRMRALKTLTLNDHVRNFALTAKNSAQFWQNLQVLNLDCCNASYEFISELKKLKSLSLGDHHSIAFLSQLLQEICNQIESLGIDCQYLKEDKKIISKFKHLKVLRYLNASDQNLMPLYSLHSLEQVEFNKTTAISNHGLLKLVQCCRNLKYVLIEQTAINNDFPVELLAWIAKNKRANGQLTFFAYKSRINKDKLPKEYSTAEMEEIVRFKFETMKKPLWILEWDQFSIKLPELSLQGKNGF